MSSPPKEYRILSEWPHALLWASVIATAMLLVGFGVISPVLVLTALASIGMVLAAAFVLYGFWFLAVKQFDRGKDPNAWAVLRAGRLGVALIPLFWLVLLVVSTPWSVSALLGLACSLPLGLMLLQWLCQPMLDKAIEAKGLGAWQARCLLWLGADVTKGLTASVENEGDDLVTLFLQYHADVNKKLDPDTKTTLIMRATARSAQGILTSLIAAGGDVSAVDGSGDSALDRAIGKGEDHDSILLCLINAGAKPNLEHTDGDKQMIAYAHALYQKKVGIQSESNQEDQNYQLTPEDCRSIRSSVTDSGQ